MVDELNKLRFASFRFRLRAATELHLPPYKGATLRGGFGGAFKDAVCVVDHRECSRCLLRAKCAYSYIFETPIPPGAKRLGRGNHAPHPFVIEPPTETKTLYQPGQTLEFGVTLFGRAIDYLPYFIFAFDRLGSAHGIGRSAGRADARGHFVVATVEQQHPSLGTVTVYRDGNGIDDQTRPVTFDDLTPGATSSTAARGSVLEVGFSTPLRLVFDDQLCGRVELHLLIRNLLRRLSNLTYFHCDAELDLDFRGLVAAAESVTLRDDQTRWLDWERFSGRQKRRIQMGGLVGRARYEGELAPLMPLLELGAITHIGKSTAFGLGRYSLQFADVSTDASAAPRADS